MRLLALVNMASSSGVGPLKMVADPGPSTITLHVRSVRYDMSQMHVGSLKHYDDAMMLLMM